MRGLSTCKACLGLTTEPIFSRGSAEGYRPREQLYSEAALWPLPSGTATWTGGQEGDS